AFADHPEHPVIDAQLAAFTDALTIAEGAGVSPLVRHMANSAATFLRPDTHFDLVRPGIGLYGISPGSFVGTPETLGLQPAMTLRARVSQVKRVPAGHGVSYGHEYTTQRDTTLALLPVGYADGIPLSASSRGPLQLGGRRRTVAGRVCMDQVVVDVGDDVVSEGDTAVLFGPAATGAPTVAEWAEAANTISYEIVTRIGPRVVRTVTGN
ncbi:MAG TPA: alanine racemase, partial [Actinobacteria bacterium]|nr:alanine racemase [Actinomycetota bacterium]